MKMQNATIKKTILGALTTNPECLEAIPIKNLLIRVRILENSLREEWFDQEVFQKYKMIITYLKEKNAINDQNQINAIEEEVGSVKSSEWDEFTDFLSENFFEKL